MSIYQTTGHRSFSLRGTFAHIKISERAARTHMKHHNDKDKIEYECGTRNIENTYAVHRSIKLYERLNRIK